MLSVFKQMPLRHLLARFGDHVIPVSCFQRPTLAAQNDFADHFVPAHFIEVHYYHFYCSLPNFVPRNLEKERLVIHRVQSSHFYRRLLLLHSSGAKLQPHFNVGIWNKTRYFSSNDTIQISTHAEIDMANFELYFISQE